MHHLRTAGLICFFFMFAIGRVGFENKHWKGEAEVRPFVPSPKPSRPKAEQQHTRPKVSHQLVICNTVMCCPGPFAVFCLAFSSRASRQPTRDSVQDRAKSSQYAQDLILERLTLFLSCIPKPQI